MHCLKLSLCFFLTIACLPSTGLRAARVVYAQDFTEDRNADFQSPPASLRFDPDAEHPGAAKGAMVFGQPGDQWVGVSLRVPAQPGQIYEVVSRCNVTGSGTNLPDHTVKLLDAEGKELISSGDRNDGDLQILIPGEGVSPEGTRWLEVSWRLRGEVAAATSRRFEIYQLEITELGEEGPRPFREQGPYIDRIQSYVGGEVSVDMADSFSRRVTGYRNDAEIPMTVEGSVITFSPTEPRPLFPPLHISAVNDAGVSVDSVPVYLRIQPDPEPLRVRPEAEIPWKNLKTQCPEPGQMLFPVDAAKLFDDGLPPFEDRIVSNPDWVEMPVNGLIGGHCPGDAPPGEHEVVIERRDARGDSVRYSLRLKVVPRRSRVATHFPENGRELAEALRRGGRVIQLQEDTLYEDFGNMYGLGGKDTSVRSPVIVLGAPGAVVSALSFNRGGHTIFENVDFALRGEGTLIQAKKTQGLRFVNCRFKGATLPVDLQDGTPWVKTDTFRYAGNAVAIREGTFLILENCRLEKFNTGLAAGVHPGGMGVYRTEVRDMADDHCFFQQGGGIWLEEVDFLGHGGNHTKGEHRDIIQLANPNQPPVRNLLIRRVFGYGDGQSQALFIENEDQRIHKSRIPYGEGSHRNILVEHSVFIGNSAHGISLRGIRDFTVRNCLTLGHPDESYRARGNKAAYGQILIRQYNQNGLIENCIADVLSLENARETAHTGIRLIDNLILDRPPGGYAEARSTLFPRLQDRSLPMRERVRFSAEWAAEHPETGPDILRP